MEKNVTKKRLRNDIMPHTREEHNKKVTFDDYKLTRCLKITFLRWTTR